MPGISSLRTRPVELAWGLFAGVCYAAMLLWPSEETVPFHLIWLSLTLVFGFRVWGRSRTLSVLVVVCGLTGAAISRDAMEGTQVWEELFEVPLMAAMFLAMVWHARRRKSATDDATGKAAELAGLLAQRERFLQEVSHELRTPVTIARGHLEVLQRSGRPDAEVTVALDELARVQRIVEGLLLLARAEATGLSPVEEIELEPFLEDVFARWSEVAPRVWRLGWIHPGRLPIAADAVRIALDALLENAVQHTGPHDVIELGAGAEAGGVAITVADEGSGIPPAALDGIFQRFARAEDDRGRHPDGLGLGLTIVATIAKAHGGRCTVRSSPRGSTFTLLLPSFTPGATVPGEREPAVSR